MDKALCNYYKSFGRNDYYNIESQSKLADFIKVNDFDEKNIDEQLGDNAQATNCLFVDMDEDFPLALNTQNKKQRCKEVFKILQHCYKYGAAPNDKNQSET
eukprot:9994_1